MENKDFKILSKSDLGGSWAPFGKGLGGSGRSFGTFGCFLAVFLGVLIHHFFNYRSKMGSKRPFGSILHRFGRFWERLGRILEMFGEDFGRIWDLMNR